jgi:hypothetical protein
MVSSQIMKSCVDRLLVVVLLLCLFGLEMVDALTAGSGPSPRAYMGFAATPDGMLYVFGGYDNSGKGGGTVVVGAAPADSCVAGDAVMRRARARPLPTCCLFFLHTPPAPASPPRLYP